ncbi:MAG: hypothetical protein ACREV6_09225 [Clostridium sp.]|uniref:hypothetical protein n=1 Tax=Clostridium sp. TaxID=1506 RepID=UPI003D6D279D
MISKKLKKVIIASMILSAVICSVKIFTPTNRETYCNFNARATSSGSVSVIAAEDMLEFKIEEYKYNFNRSYGKDQFIVITPKKELKDNSMFYFEVEGEIEPYILHIDPVELSKYSTEIQLKSSAQQLKINGEKCFISSNEQYFVSEKEEKYYVPISAEVNLINKYFNLTSKQDFLGNITLKYLNQFIVDKKPMSLDKNYLMQTGLYGSNQDTWKYIKEQMFKNNRLFYSLDSAASKINFETVDIAPNMTDKPSYMNFDSDTTILNGQQQTIIDIIAKGYTGYVSNLKEYILKLENNKKELEYKNNQLDAKNKELETMVYELQNRSMEFENNTSNIQSENNKLNVEVSELTKKINTLISNQNKVPKVDIPAPVADTKAKVEPEPKTEILIPLPTEIPNK